MLSCSKSIDTDPPLRADGEEVNDGWNGSSAGPLLCFGAFVFSRWAYSPVYGVDDFGAGLDQRCIYHSSVQLQFDPMIDEGVNSRHH